MNELCTAWAAGWLYIVNEPSILGENVRFWTCGTSPQQRRDNEYKQVQAVCKWFVALGMTVTYRSNSAVFAVMNDYRAAFFYREQFDHPYKRLQVDIGCKRTNITALRKLAKDNQ